MTTTRSTKSAGPDPRPEALARTDVDTPIGVLTVIVSDRGLRAVLFPEADGPRGSGPGDGPAADPGRKPRPPLPPGVALDDDHPFARAAAAQLTEWFAGDRSAFDLPLDPVGTPFQRRVWDVLRGIGFGETATYAAVAEAATGDRGRARAVGTAVGRNPIPIVVPCHRVIGADGSLTGFAGGLATKRALLDHEAGNAVLPLS